MASTMTSVADGRMSPGDAAPPAVDAPVANCEPDLRGVNGASSNTHASGSAVSAAGAAATNVDYGASPALPQPVRVYGVILVDFDHSVGPKVEYATPASLRDDEELSRTLPFLALPDGAHAHDEDFAYFHLLCPSVSPATIFGISCNRQLAASRLVKRSSDVTRSTVQKAIVVLASQPVFGPLRDKLGVITRAFFAQGDFSETAILDDFRHSLEVGLVERGRNSESAMYMGTSVRELIHKFRFKTLMLLKLLMLQRRIMFYGTQVERLCTFQYSLVSLMPTLLTNLDDAGSPLLDERTRTATRSTELRTSDRASLMRYLGLPLDVFGPGAFFQPYLPLQQIDMLQSARAYLVGTTNAIFQQQRDCQIDVLVNVDTGHLDFFDQKLASLVTLTAADRKWMGELVSTVSESYNAEDPARPLGMKFVGSDDFLRARFEEYVCSALAAIKFADFLHKGKAASVLITGDDLANHLAAYNESWIAAFKQTPACALWDRTTDAVIFDLVEPRHPCEGQTHLVQDVGIRLVQGVHDLHLDENLAPTKEALRDLATTGGKLAQTGGERAWQAVSALKADLLKRQADYRDKRERERLASEASNGAAPLAENTSNGGPSRAAVASPPLSASVSAGVAAASQHAASLASSVGSFWASATKPKGGNAGFVPKQLNLSPDPDRSPGPGPGSTRRASKPTPSPPLAPAENPGALSGNLQSLWRRASAASAAAEPGAPPPVPDKRPFRLSPASTALPVTDTHGSEAGSDGTPFDSRRSSRLSDVAL